jgi:hypothetical protein
MFKIVFNILAALCDVAFVFLISGLMGIPGLCSFNREFSVGGRVGFLNYVFGLFPLKDFIALL